MMLVLSVGLAATVIAWTPPERVDRKPAGYIAFLPSLAVSNRGVPHVVWLECAGGTNLYKIMYARRSGDTWTIPVNVSRDSGDLRRADIVVDTAGVPLVVWSEQYLQRISYARLAGDSWTTPKPAFVRPGVVPRLVVDSYNRTHMLFGEAGGSYALLYSAYCREADSWTTPTVVADDSGALAWHDLTADRNGRLHAVWMNFRTYGVDYSTFDGDSWSTPEHLPDPGPSGQSCDPRIACDSLGRPHVVWEERWGGYRTYYSARFDDTWTVPGLVTGLNCRLPEVAVDRLDRVHVVWSWDYGTLHTVKTDTGWSSPDTVNHCFASTSMACTGDRLHLAFSDTSTRVFYTEKVVVGGLAEGRSWDVIPLAGSTLAKHGAVIAFVLRRAGPVWLTLVDVAGRDCRLLALGTLVPGAHRVYVSTDSLPIGVYSCVIKGAESAVVGRIVKVR
jgi:hypothetical protein